jgi:hypothetical protein
MVNLEEVLAGCKNNRLIKKIEEGLVTSESGHKVYWPEKINGYLDEYSLILIAAVLHKHNKLWDEEIAATLNRR